MATMNANDVYDVKNPIKHQLRGAEENSYANQFEG
jgi:hypothetical protein